MREGCIPFSYPTDKLCVCVCISSGRRNIGDGADGGRLTGRQQAASLLMHTPTAKFCCSTLDPSLLIPDIGCTPSCIFLPLFTPPDHCLSLFAYPDPVVSDTFFRCTPVDTLTFPVLTSLPRSLSHALSGARRDS